MKKKTTMKEYRNILGKVKNSDWLIDYHFKRWLAYYEWVVGYFNQPSPKKRLEFIKKKGIYLI